MTRRILLWAWVMLCLLGAPPFYFVYGQDAVTDTTLSISADVESPGPKAIKTAFRVLAKLGAVLHPFYLVVHQDVGGDGICHWTCHLFITIYYPQAFSSEKFQGGR